MNISDIDVLMTVIKVGTYSAAAEALNLNDHSAVGKQIRRLERSLHGVTLLDRDDSGKAVLTDIGKSLLPQMIVAKQAYQEMSNCLGSMSEPGVGIRY